MLTLSIGNAACDIRSKSDIDENWINREINGRRAAGMKPCVKVVIKNNECDMILSTPACVNGLGGGRAPNSCEREMFELWAKKGMNDIRFTGGNLVAFLHQLLKN